MSAVTAKGNRMKTLARSDTDIPSAWAQPASRHGKNRAQDPNDCVDNAGYKLAPTFGDVKETVESGPEDSQPSKARRARALYIPVTGEQWDPAMAVLLFASGHAPGQSFCAKYRP